MSVEKLTNEQLIMSALVQLLQFASHEDPAHSYRKSPVYLELVRRLERPITGEPPVEKKPPRATGRK